MFLAPFRLLPVSNKSWWEILMAGIIESRRWWRWWMIRLQSRPCLVLEPWIRGALLNIWLTFISRLHCIQQLTRTTCKQTPQVSCQHLDSSTCPLKCVKFWWLTLLFLSWFCIYKINVYADFPVEIVKGKWQGNAENSAYMLKFSNIKILN